MSLSTDNTSVPLPPPFNTIPRIPLLYSFPSPIEPLPRLSQHLSTQNTTAPHDTPASGSRTVELYIKRDDTSSGLSGGGGNKLRKLEYVLADAVKVGAEMIVTEGGVQSNHMRQTVAAGNRVGLKTVLLPRDIVPNHSSAYREGGNVQFTHLMGAVHLPNDTPEFAAITSLQGESKKPYFIPSGASLHPLGGLGYARCAFEIAQQEKELFGEGETFGVIVVPTMSGSTLGGLVAGFAAVDQRAKEKKKRRLVGVLASPKDKAEFTHLVLGIARTAAELIDVAPESITEEDFEIDDRWSAGQYGRLDDQTREGIKLLASVEGVITDPVYSGKALTGLMEMVKGGEVGDGERVLFMHTGGVVSVGAYEELR